MLRFEGWTPFITSSLDPDLAAGDLLQPRDHVQERRFATARRADQHQELALLDRDVDRMEDLDWAIGFGGVVDVEKTHGPYPLTEPAIRPRTK